MQLTCIATNACEIYNAGLRDQFRVTNVDRIEDERFFGVRNIWFLKGKMLIRDNS